MLSIFFREDKSALNKVVEAVKTNFNDRAEEVCTVCVKEIYNLSVQTCVRSKHIYIMTMQIDFCF